MIGGGLKLYTKATSSIKMEDKGSNTVIPFLTITKANCGNHDILGGMSWWFLKDLVPMSILSGRIHILFAQTH